VHGSQAQRLVAWTRVLVLIQGGRDGTPHPAARGQFPWTKYHAEARGGPPLLAQALRHAVMPGGARVRPKLCMAVAMACSTAPQPSSAARAGMFEASLATALGASVAIELLHCASLVHDDLPCFDNAPTRRGQA
jgi:geranylgeranyl pyrophosphate synthase